jgi:hypothetical protein
MTWQKSRILHMIIWSFIATPISSFHYTHVVGKIKIPGPLGVVVKILVDQLFFAPIINTLYLFILTWMKTGDIN